MGQKLVLGTKAKVNFEVPESTGRPKLTRKLLNRKGGRAMDPCPHRTPHSESPTVLGLMF